MPTGTISTPQFEAEIQMQIDSLDAMFQDPGLASLRANTPTHPGVVRRDMLASFLPRRARPYPELLAIATEIGGGLIDRQFWMPDPDSSPYWSFLSDADAAARVAQNIHDPGKFEETLAEVRTWAMLTHGGARATLLEEEGKPDIVLDRGSTTEAWAEIKFIHTTTTDRGLLRALQKANKQLRAATCGGAGIVYVYIERVHAPRVLPSTTEAAEAARLPSGEDPPPADVASRIATVELALSGNNYKSLALTAVTREDHSYIGEWPGPVTYFVRRQAVLRRHVTPRPAPAVDDQIIRPAGWTAFRLGPTAT